MNNIIVIQENIQFKGLPNNPRILDGRKESQYMLMIKNETHDFEQN